MSMFRISKFPTASKSTASLTAPARNCLRRAGYRRARSVAVPRAQLQIFTQDDIQVERFLGTLGFVDVFRYSLPEGESMRGLGLTELQQLNQQQVEESGFQVRLYSGKLLDSGDRVLLKAYPQKFIQDADILAANEVATHAALQPPSVQEECPGVAELLGGFQVSRGVAYGEQWLVFRYQGITTVGVYAERASRATAEGGPLTGGMPPWPGEMLLNTLDNARPLRQRKKFLLKIMRQIIQGLAFMHSQYRLHQSLGPSSVILNTYNETLLDKVQARLRDLAFAVDVSDEAMWGGATLAELWEGRDYNGKSDFRKKLSERLYTKARQSGAWTEREKRSFGVADDIYAAGLLLLMLCIVPLSPPGAQDYASLQRLVEVSFKNDVNALREYLAADEDLALAVDFLNTGNEAGWDLLEAMLDANWKRRPTAESCLQHPFLTGAAFSDNPPVPPGRQAANADALPNN